MSFAWKDDHMETFLEIYRNHECLWHNKSGNYHKTNDDYGGWFAI